FGYDYAFAKTVSSRVMFYATTQTVGGKVIMTGYLRNAYLQYDDGSTVGTCSLHCAAVDLALTIDKTPSAIMVADYTTRKLIDSEKAFWVVGGDKPGVMTKRAKWAFEKKVDAEAFVKGNGGTLTTFDEAMKSGYEDMYQDTKMIRDKRRMMKQKGMMEHKH
ncbi:MAG: hypothetical protein HGA78_09785, partial [Nitrospirales bacterium]|nr:hypothetical protein [Nitrospirales bacterium]